MTWDNYLFPDIDIRFYLGIKMFLIKFLKWKQMRSLLNTTFQNLKVFVYILVGKYIIVPKWLFLY